MLSSQTYDPVPVCMFNEVIYSEGAQVKHADGEVLQCQQRMWLKGDGTPKYDGLAAFETA